jgi:polar amino acid transport system substrate-binding protein
MISKNLIHIVALISTSVSSLAYAETFSGVADEWCPYTCKDGAAGAPGFEVLIMQEVMKSMGHKLDYKIVPWSRAIVDIQSGKEHILISPTNQQVVEQKLSRNQEPIGVSNDCLWVRSDNNLKFKVADDMNGLKAVATVQGYSYAQELGKWLDRPENKAKVFPITGDEPAERNAKKLLAGSIDGIVENRDVMGYINNKLKSGDKIRSAGCNNPGTPMYVAVSPQMKDGEKFLKDFDAGIAKLRKSGKLKAILSKYGVKDWK